MTKPQISATYSRLLHHFLTVVDRKNVTSAAKDLHITQSALTKSIRRLECNLGVTLFERMPTGVVPTTFGNVLARRVRLMNIEYRRALGEIRSIDGRCG